MAQIDIDEIVDIIQWWKEIIDPPIEELMEKKKILSACLGMAAEDYKYFATEKEAAAYAWESSRDGDEYRLLKGGNPTARSHVQARADNEHKKKAWHEAVAVEKSFNKFMYQANMVHEDMKQYLAQRRKEWDYDQQMVLLKAKH